MIARRFRELTAKLPYKNFLRRLLEVVGVFVAVILVGKIFPHFAGVVMCTILIGGYYCVTARCLRFCKINFLDAFQKDLPGILIVSIIGTGFIALMVGSQHTIYIWDQLETWEPTLECVETTFTDPHQALKELRGSINHADYNKFLPMLIALPMHMFGKSFLCYTLYVWLMFALPAIFFAATTFKTLLENSGVKSPSISVLMAIIMLLPILEVPVLVGYANISILLPGAIIFAMLMSLSRSEIQREPLILIGVLCIFAVFQARTAAYMILGEFFGYAVYVAITSFQERNFQRDMLTLCKKFFVIGISALLIASPLFFTFIKHAVTYNIGAAYSAYQLGLDFPMRLLAHVAYVGIALYVIFIAGVVVSLWNKKIFPLAAMLLTWSLTATILISRVQIMDRQHYYTLILPFAFMIIALLIFTFARKKIVGAIVIVVMAFNFLQTFYSPLYIETVFTRLFYLPDRYDVEEIKNFVAELNKLTAGTDKKIYTPANSVIYSGHVFSKFDLPNRHEALPSLMATAGVDLRDGFPTGFFDAEFVLIPLPIQTHLLPENQQVVVKTSELMTNSTPISRHYKLIREDTLHPNMYGVEAVTFKLYEKISPLEKSDIDFVEKIFVELYPNNDDLFKNRFENYKREHFK